MRIGVGLPFKDQRGLPLDAAGLGLRARWIEEAGLDAAWMGDASFRRLATWPDPMMWLLTVGAATSRIEVGTAIYQVPLRPPVDLAQQFTNMIMAERGFQANSRVITTSDEILQDLVNIKH